MVFMAKSSVSETIIQNYALLRDAISKRDLKSMEKLVDSPTKKKMDESEFTKEVSDALLELFPNPKEIELVDLLNNGSDYCYRFRFKKPDSEGSYFYGALFYTKEGSQFKFNRILSRNVLVEKGENASKIILEELNSDPEFLLDKKEIEKLNAKNSKKNQEKTSNELSLRNEYENGWTPYVIVTPPKGWFDMNSSGNSSYGGFETLTMGGIGFSQSGEADYSTKRKMEFGFCKSNKSIVDFSEALKTSGFTITKISDSSFSAFKKDKFWGSIFQLIRTEAKGFLVGSVSSESNSDFEFSKKALMEIFPKIKIKF